MNILFMSLCKISSIKEHGIYSDLLREFVKHGHNVVILSSYESNSLETQRIINENHVKIICVETGKIQKTSKIKKGINTLLIGPRYEKAIKKYLSKIHFDLIIYPTPPITFVNAVNFVKKRDAAKTYLLLKDIFPQNALDIGMMQATGLKGLIYKYFRNKERRLYSISDYIGCMSEANVKYLLEHNSNIKRSQVEVCPNSIEPVDLSVDDKTVMRIKYGLPIDKKIFIYGGNLGKPQGIPFMIECIRELKENATIFFVIIGSGTEYNKIDGFIKSENPGNVKLLRGLPKDEYDQLVGSCDIGLIFLDHRFTIPNFPSRLLSYMQAKLPVLAATDQNTDIGKVITENGFGWWCESNKKSDFCEKVKKIGNDQIFQKGTAGWRFLLNNYSAARCYGIIADHIIY